MFYFVLLIGVRYLLYLFFFRKERGGRYFSNLRDGKLILCIVRVGLVFGSFEVYLVKRKNLIL